MMTPRFQVGDRVKRIDAFAPIYMENGTIVQVILDKDGLEQLTQYEVNFADRAIARFYETQLRRIDGSAKG